MYKSINLFAASSLKFYCPLLCWHIIMLP
uniref:Uncharacterized protein n=1 Tax=Arundo donax TaxID=35708 RepID=A0A0A9BUN4_ARUDO